jgi:hypothetical protein
MATEGKSPGNWRERLFDGLIALSAMVAIVRFVVEIVIGKH